jgi:hypothetical protein
VEANKIRDQIHRAAQRRRTYTIHVRLLELQFTFRVEDNATDQVTVTFNSSEQVVSCSSFLFNGRVRERTYLMSKAPSEDYAHKLAGYFLKH